MTSAATLVASLLPPTWPARGQVVLCASAVDTRFPGIGGDLVLLMLAEVRDGAPEPRDADMRTVLHELLAAVGGAPQERRLTPRPASAVTP
jgi:hypothetical protein